MCVCVYVCQCVCVCVCVCVRVCVCGLDLIKAMKVRKFWKRGSEGVTLLENGDIWALVAYVGWCMRGHKAGQTYLKFTHPYIDENHTGVQKYGYLSIVKLIDRKNWEAAHAYINGFLSEETQYQMSTQSGTTPVNGAFQDNSNGSDFITVETEGATGGTGLSGGGGDDDDGTSVEADSWGRIKSYMVN